MSLSHDAVPAKGYIAPAKEIKSKRRRLTPEERKAMYAAALNRAQNCQVLAGNGAPTSNFANVISVCMARGYADPNPGENVLTFNAWKALDRKVKKGEKGIPVHVVVERDATDTEQNSEISTIAAVAGVKPSYKKTVTSYVFHICQTEPVTVKLDAFAPPVAVETPDEVAQIQPNMAAFAKLEMPRSILLYRAGDFFESFDDDAKIIADTLGVTLTSRNGTPLTEIPGHTVERYLLALIRAGFKTAIVDVKCKETTEFNDANHPVFAGL